MLLDASCGIVEDRCMIISIEALPLEFYQQDEVDEQGAAYQGAMHCWQSSIEYMQAYKYWSQSAFAVHRPYLEHRSNFLSCLIK